jgi:hypothetical protein
MSGDSLRVQQRAISMNTSLFDPTVRDRMGEIAPTVSARSRA